MSETPRLSQNTPLLKISRRSVELDDLATPYFRKSVSYSSCKSDDAIEQKIADFLDAKGVFLVERGEEFMYLHSRKNSSALAKEVSERYLSVTQTPTNKSRLSSFDLGGNGLFMRRKLSTMKTPTDGL